MNLEFIFDQMCEHCVWDYPELRLYIDLVVVINPL